MSIAILPMSAEFNWNPATVGLIQSSFFWGYLLTQVNFVPFQNYDLFLAYSSLFLSMYMQVLY